MQQAFYYMKWIRSK